MYWLQPRSHAPAFRELGQGLARHRRLTWELAKREIADRYKGQVLGSVWAVGHPLILIGIYIFVFAVVFQTKISGTHGFQADYAAYLLAACEAPASNVLAPLWNQVEVALCESWTQVHAPAYRDYVARAMHLQDCPEFVRMLRDTLAALEQLPEASNRLRKNLPKRAHPVLRQLEIAMRQNLQAAEAYNMVPGRDPQNG